MSHSQSNLNSSVKKLIATKFPSIKIKLPAIKAISICTESFIELLVQATATVCNDKQKNLITSESIFEALDQLEFQSLTSKAREANSEISSNIKKKRESWKSLKTPEDNLTEEETARVMEELHREALQFNEEKRKKETEQSKAKDKP